MKKLFISILLLFTFINANNNLEKEAENFLKEKFFNKKNVKTDMSVFGVWGVAKHETKPGVYYVLYSFSGAFKTDHHPECIEYYNNDKCKKLINSNDSIFWKKTSDDEVFVDWGKKIYIWYKKGVP